jgi:hypothetical protein
MFPGVILQMTYWYRPDEMSLRLLYFCKRSTFCYEYSPTNDAVLDMLGSFSTAISGVLAYAFSFASGRGGLSGWQWLFLVEGIFTVLFGIALYFILPDCEYSLLSSWTCTETVLQFHPQQGGLQKRRKLLYKLDFHPTHLERQN